MTIRFEVRERFECSPQRLFSTLVDLRQAGEWMPDFVSMEQLTAGEFGVGTVFRETRSFRGKKTVEEFQVTTFAPPGRLDLVADGTRGSTGRGEYRFSYELAADGAATSLVLRIEAHGMSFWLELLAPFFKIVFRKILAKDHAALRAYLARSAA